VITVIFGAFEVWSAVNPSFFTIKKFGVTASDKALIETGFLIAVTIIIIVSVGSFALVGVYAK
jgi:hypothetical protein